MRNDYLENRRQAQLNKARGQGYAGDVRCFFSILLARKLISLREQLQFIMLVRLVMSLLK